MFLRQRVIAVLALAWLPVLSCEAAWMRQEGEVSAMAGFSMSDGGSFFDRAGSQKRDNCGTTATIPLLAEYGASYYRTYFASSSYSTYSCGGGQVYGFNDFDVGMRGRLNVFTNDQTWEVAAIIPAFPSPNGAANHPKHLGVRIGLNSSNRIDTYQSFSAGEMAGPNAFSYGMGIRTWTGHIPHELSAYLGWGHVMTDSVWAADTGGWNFSARLDMLQSFGKEHNAKPGPGVFPVTGVLDRHDKFSLLSGSVAVWHNLSPLSGIQLSVSNGLWGRNISNPLGLHVSYSKTWRN